jgi:hypothetical protein
MKMQNYNVAQCMYILVIERLGFIILVAYSERYVQLAHASKSPYTIQNAKPRHN